MGTAFLITLAFCIFEFIGGKISGSLSLLADATHMLTDVSSLGLALFASWMSGRHATRKMSYGYYRLEILAALVNGALLLTLAFFITKEAFRRLQTPPSIHTGLMLVVALIGLAVNLGTGWMLGRFAGRNINVRGALFHVFADALSSVGVLAAGIVLAVTGWRYADSAASFVIATLILASAWWLLKEVVEVLLEAAPSHINLEMLEKKILSVPGVEAIHDLHVWTISSGKESLSAHLEVKCADTDALLAHVNQLLSHDFEIHHTTLQVEIMKCKTGQNDGTRF